MAVQVYVYNSLEERDRNTKEGGSLKGEANNPEELDSLINTSGHGAVGYFEGETRLGSYEAALKAVGGWPRYMEDFEPCEWA